MADDGDGFEDGSGVGRRRIAAGRAEPENDPRKSLEGHRHRLRERFRSAGADALADYELLELLLFRSLPRRDTKPIAKRLIARFGSFGEVLGAAEAQLAETEGVGPAVALDLKAVLAATQRLTRGRVRGKQVLASWSQVIEYCRAAMAFGEREQFRML